MGKEYTMKVRAPLPDDVERLAILAEELAEASQAAMKIVRFGWDSYNPCDVEWVGRNGQALERELGDVLSAIRLLAANGDLSLLSIAQRADIKDDEAPLWFRHQTTKEKP